MSNRFVKDKLSKTDIKMFADFKARYPTWNIFRLMDNSLVHVPPSEEDQYVKPVKPHRNILRVIS